MSNQLFRKVAQSPEVSGARSRLDDVLQHLVEKAEKVDDSVLAEQVESPKTPEEDSSKVDILDGHSSKSGKKHKSSRKRKKDYHHGRSSEHGSLEKGKYQLSFVMKLFDRQVDLAQFKASSPLYPVCREWMNNKPLKKRRTTTRTPSPEPPDEDSSDPNDQVPKDIYHLPLPSIAAEEFRDKQNRDPRIPSPVPQPEETLNIHSDMSEAPSRETLLDGHLSRWREIRYKWKAASDDYQSRYTESYAILKEMYERQ